VNEEEVAVDAKRAGPILALCKELYRRRKRAGPIGQPQASMCHGRSITGNEPQNSHFDRSPDGTLVSVGPRQRVHPFILGHG
jgi:hypothetical protein